MVAINAKAVGAVVLLVFVKWVFGVQDRGPADLGGDGYRGDEHRGVTTSDLGDLGREATGTDHSSRRIGWPKTSVSADIISLLWVRAQSANARVQKYATARGSIDPVV